MSAASQAGPGPVASRGPGRPAVLSREQIVAAASSFDNIDALTMRQLAERLDVRHGALYRWVRNRDDLFDLVSQTVVDRILAELGTTPEGSWRDRLGRLAHAMRTAFLAVPGYASHVARPHPHHAHSADRLRVVGVALFREAGATPAMAEQSWLVFVTSVIAWLAAEERPVSTDDVRPRFDLFLGVLLRGLPTDRADAARTSAGRAR